jgi:RNA polymerase sigma factor (sigma-70 family)
VSLALLEDMQLLETYARTGSEAAFSTLVNRHIDWVYSICLRGVRDRHLAEDVTQAVFLLLSQKAAAMNPETILRGWLFKTARFAVSDALKKRSRARKHHERVAMMTPDPVQGEEEQAWEGVAPVLEEAVSMLNDNDRHAVLLRFYEGKSLAEVGQKLGISEEAAKKRVARAVEKLRAFMGREGLSITALLLIGLLMTNAAQAAPAHLGLSVAKACAGSKAASGMATAIATGARKGMLGATGRLMAALVGGILILLLALGIGFLFGGASATKRQAVSKAEPSAPAAPSIDLNQFKKIYVGSKDKIIFQHDTKDPFDHDLTRFPIGQRQGDLFAVLIDRDGRAWAKQLDPANFRAKDAHYDEIPSPAAAAVARNDSAALLSILLGDGPPVASGGGPVDFGDAYLRGGPTGADRASTNTSAGVGAGAPSGLWWSLPTRGGGLSDKDDDDDEERIIVDDSPLPIDELMLETMFFDGGANPGNPKIRMVPEPGSILTLLGAAGLLALRRRRR